MRIAVVEFLPYHELTVSSISLQLSSLGHAVSIFNDGIFAEFRRTDFTCPWLPLSEWHPEEFDGLVCTTVDSGIHGNYLERLVHQGYPLLGLNHWEFPWPEHRLGVTSVHEIQPIYISGRPRPSWFVRPRHGVVVQGQIESSRRNYAQVEELSRLIDDPSLLRILGWNLEGRTSKLSMQDRLRSDEYYDELCHSQFLFNPTDSPRYLHGVFSSSYFCSVGMVVPLIIPEPLANAWKLKPDEECLVYKTIKEIPEKINEFSGTRYGDLCEKLQIRRDTILAENLRRLRLIFPVGNETDASI